MTFDLRRTVDECNAAGAADRSFGEHINPRFAKVLGLIGFDRHYVRALGPHLWDSAGNKFLDMIGGYGVCNVGRNHPVVRRAIEDALALELPNWVAFEAPPLAGALAGELKRRVGRGLDRVFFTNSGTEGIEAAIKFAKCATGRAGLVSCHRGFHGLTTGALALNGCPSFRSGFEPLIAGTRQVPFADLAELECQLRSGDVAAFVVEPIQGKGVHIPPAGWLKAAERLCRKFGTLLIVDEVQTGVGRTGAFLGIDHEVDVEPDILVLSKGLSGGMIPVGAVMTRVGVWDRVFSSLDRSIIHSSTFQMGTLAMAAGLAALSVIDDEKLSARAAAMGDLLRIGIEDMRPRYPSIGAVRQRGLMLAIEFIRPTGLLERAAWDLIHAADKNLFTQATVIPLMSDHRILTQVAGHDMDVLKLTPPLCIDVGDVRWFLDGFAATMNKLHQTAGPVRQLVAGLGRNALFGSKAQ